MGQRVAEMRGGKVAKCPNVEGFVAKEQDFEVDVLGAWEPMEIVKDRGRGSIGGVVDELLSSECARV